MEKKLIALFDLQKFGENKRLSRLIDEAEQDTNGAIDEDDLLFVAAAGEANPSKEEDTNHGN